MKYLLFAAASALLAMPTAISAHPRMTIKGEAQMAARMHHRVIMASAGEPRARIRSDVSGNGLTPLAFAQWLAVHPQHARNEGTKLMNVSGRTSVLNLVSPMFSDADKDGNGRISAAELADFVAAFSLQRAAHHIA